MWFNLQNHHRFILCSENMKCRMLHDMSTWCHPFSVFNLHLHSLNLQHNPFKNVEMCDTNKIKNKKNIHNFTVYSVFTSCIVFHGVQWSLPFTDIGNFLVLIMSLLQLFWLNKWFLCSKHLSTLNTLSNKFIQMNNELNILNVFTAIWCLDKHNM